MTPPRHNVAYRPEVDGLRALAVVPVILFHAGFDWFGGGFVGVDVFFVISGYLITSIILAEAADGRFSIIAFYERRARRILPALILVVLACIPFAWSWMPPAELRDFSRGIVAVALFVSNVFLWTTSSYFDSAAEEKPLLHTWSLGVEEQYYLVFPLFVLLTWKLGRDRQKWLIVMIAAASLLLSEWGWRHEPMANFYLAPTRAWELLIGSLLAFHLFDQPRDESRSRRISQALSLLGALMVIGSIVAYGKKTPFPSTWALAPTIGTALILWFADHRTLVGRLLSVRWIVQIGLVSYSAYLWHQPVFAIARLRNAERPTATEYAVLSLVAIALAILSWRYVERPFRDRRRVSRRRIFLFSLIGSSFLIALGLIGEIGKGLPSRLSDPARQQLATASYSPLRERCHTGSKDFQPPEHACRYVGDNTTWAVFGDSHVVEPAYAMAALVARRGEGILHLSFSGCPPALLYESREPGCTEWLRRSVQLLEADSRIRNVVIGFRYSSHIYGDHAPTYPRLPKEPLPIDGLDADRSRELLWESFSAIVDRLLRAGKQVFVIGPIPELGKPVRQIILAGQFRHADSDVGSSRHYYETRNHFVLEKLRAMPWSERLHLIDPAAALCSNESCYAVIDGTAMYFDDNHLSIAGAVRVMSLAEAYVGAAQHD